MNCRAKENLVVNNKDNRVLCLGTLGLIVAPWKFDVLKTSIFALEASLLGQIFVLKHQISAGQLSADSSSTEALYCLIRVHSLSAVHEMQCFYSLSTVLEECLDVNG